ncbi:MAG: trigger factor [Chloroflexi bacterium]|nr:trigger factor [Chloroflexota bacterium]
MKVTQEQLVQREAVLKIEVEAAELDQGLERAYRRLAQRVTVPGFRRGKAPRGIVERVLGHETLLNEALDYLIPELTAQALKDQKLEIAAQPRVELVQTDPVVLRATVPLVPAVEVGDYKALRVLTEPMIVGEDDVQKSLENLRREMSPWAPVERPVQEGDLLTIELQGIVGTQVVFKDEALPYIAAAGSPLPVPGFAKALVGASKGETREFDLPFPPDYPNEELQGKTCHFTVAVREIKEQQLPPLDDEFAQGVGEGYSSLEALREEMRRKLRDKAGELASQRYNERVVEAATGSSFVELPPLLVERETDHLLEQEGRTLARINMSLDDHLKAIGKTQEAHREEFREPAIQRLRRFFVLSKIADLEGIEVSQDETDQHIEQQVKDSGDQGPVLRRLLSQEAARDSLVQALRQQKTIQRLAAICQGAPEATAAVPSATEGTPPAESTSS